jgi:hypothetical protein
LYTYRISNDAVVVDDESEEPVAEVLGGYEVGRYRGEGEERGGGGFGGGYAVGGNLVEDA